MNDEIKLGIYYILINILVYSLVRIDKKRAVSKSRRIPEKTLWQLSLLGGSFGLWFGMKQHHHKTKKMVFRIGSVSLCLFHCVIIITALFYL